MTGKPLVAIVGRPNVGKSTLFNRIARSRTAIVSDVPGTTRDRITKDVSWLGRDFILVDTGGLLPFEEQEIWEKVKAQVEEAIQEADVIVMVVDASVGISSTDRDVAELLRRTGKTVVLCANKAEGRNREQQAMEFYELAIGEPLPVSAYHNRGLDELLDRVAYLLPEQIAQPEAEEAVKIAIVGRTNVGKSTLLNAILGYERVIVSPVPGTTRDAIDSPLTLDGRSLLLIDTAGIRRRGKVEPGIEKYSVLRAVRGVERADVVLLVLDGAELVTAQDTHVASYVLDAYKGVILVVNKWDLAQEMGFERSEILQEVRNRFKFISYAPVVFSSALEGAGIQEVLKAAIEVYEEWSRKVPRGEVSRVLMSAIADNPPPMYGKRGLKIHRVAQESTRPPTFVFYGNRSDLVHFSYRRYLDNVLHKAFGFQGVPLKLVFKGRGKR